MKTSLDLGSGVLSLQSSVFGPQSSVFPSRRRHQGVACHIFYFILACFFFSSVFFYFALSFLFFQPFFYIFAKGRVSVCTPRGSLYRYLYPGIGPLARSLAACGALLRIGSNYCGKPLSYNLPD